MIRFLCISIVILQTLSLFAADSLYQGFQNPPMHVRPFFRWWWNGNRVTAEEVIREMRLMRDAGAGGVEINPIGLHEIYGDPPQLALDWLSDEWNAVLMAAINEGEQNGMIIDLIVGSGWPFGGQFLSNDETVQGVELEIITVTGPTLFQDTLHIPKDNDHKLLQVTLYPKTVSQQQPEQDVTSLVSEEGVYSISIPDGEHEIYVLTWRNCFRDVMHGAPGADGPVLDHFNKKAVLKYLNRMSNTLNSLFAGKMGKSIRSLFCDSIELEGANWTGDLSVEFKVRRGYALEPYLPLVLHYRIEAVGSFADTLKRVRYDYAKTMAELFMERFIMPYHDWCYENGVQSRYQAYGYPWLYTDLLDGYLVPDIPESDQWLYNPGWVHSATIDDIRYATWNKYASSSGHLMERKVVSCEAMTNTRGVFQATLEYIKQATDINIIGGINHLVLHGFNYSPPEVDFPGWIRFGTYFSEHNPWWKYHKLWADYAARLCWIFQETMPVSDVAIMGPTADVWSEKGLDRNPWIMTPPYLHALWQALNHHGYTSDYVNGTILQRAKMGNGKLRFGKMEYKALILVEIESLEPETAEAILAYVQKGGKILVVGKIPFRSPSLEDYPERDQRVHKAIQTAMEKYPHSVQFVEPPDIDSLTPWIGQKMKKLDVKPAVKISSPDPKLFVAHQKTEEQHVVFFSNMDRKRTLDVRANTIFESQSVWEWSAETGKRRGIGIAPELMLQLTPMESKLFVFETAVSPNSQTHDEPALRVTNRQQIADSWDVTFQPQFGTTFTRQMVKLVDFRDDDILKSFAGTAIYRTTFPVDQIGQYQIDLGEVYDIAEVRINGESVGVRWWGEKKLMLGSAIKPGINALEIHVTTALYNYCYALKDENPVIQWWYKRMRYPDPVPTGLVGPVTINRLGQ